MRIAYQGEPGAYSEAAALQFGGPEVETLPCKSFDEVFEAVVKKRATHGVVPLARGGVRAVACTSKPSSCSGASVCEPMKPVAPVTRTRVTAESRDMSGHART